MRKICCLWLVLIFSTVPTNAGDEQIPIKIKTNESIEFGQLFYFEQFSIGRQQSLDIQVELNNTKYDENFGFLIVQIHSFLNDVKIVKNGNPKNDFLYGRNVGVKTYENFRLSVINPLYYTQIEIAIAAVLYSKNSPMPGGCTMEINENVALNLTLNKFKNMIQTEVHLARNLNVLNNSNFEKCLNFYHTYKFYYKYFPQSDLSAVTYFRIIKDMIDVRSIQTKGSLASKHINGISNRRNFLNVPGTGVIYNAIVISDSTNGIAAYVPVVTYSCHPVGAKNDCYLIPFTIEWAIPAMYLIIVGLLHIFIVLENRTRELFYHSYAIGIYIMIFFIATFDNLQLVGRFGMVIIGGLLFGLILCMVCHKFNKTLIALDFTSKLILSWILSIVIQYLLNDNAYFGKDWIYWTTFTFVILISMVGLILTRACSESDSCYNLFKLISPIVCVIVAANAFLLGIQILIGSNMLLILFNHIHNIMDVDFKTANGIVKPSAKDLCIFIAMPVLIIMGTFFQSKKLIMFKNAKNLNVTIKDNQTALQDLKPVRRRWGNGSDSVFDSPKNTPSCYDFLKFLHKKRQRSYSALQ